MANLIRLRRDIASRWEFINPRLALGEPGYEIDTRQLKIGDGVTAWNDLPYFIPGQAPEGNLALLQHIDEEEPHHNYDDGTSLILRYQNATV